MANSETLRETLKLQVDVSQLLPVRPTAWRSPGMTGSGNLYYTAHMNLYLPADQVQALDRGIIVSRSYYRPDDRTTPVTQVQPRRSAAGTPDHRGACMHCIIWWSMIHCRPVWRRSTNPSRPARRHIQPEATTGRIVLYKRMGLVVFQPCRDCAMNEW